MVLLESQGCGCWLSCSSLSSRDSVVLLELKTGDAGCYALIILWVAVLVLALLLAGYIGLDHRDGRYMYSFGYWGDSAIGASFRNLKVADGGVSHWLWAVSKDSGHQSCSSGLIDLL